MKLLVLISLGLLLLPLRLAVERKILKATRTVRDLSAMLQVQPKTIGNLLSGCFYLWLWYALYFGYIAFSTSDEKLFVGLVMWFVIPVIILAILCLIFVWHSCHDISTQRPG